MNEDRKMKEIEREITRIFELYTIKAKNDKKNKSKNIGLDLMQLHSNLNSIYKLFDVYDTVNFDNRESLRLFIAKCYEDYFKSI